MRLSDTHTLGQNTLVSNIDIAVSIWLWGGIDDYVQASATATTNSIPSLQRSPRQTATWRVPVTSPRSVAARTGSTSSSAVHLRQIQALTAGCLKAATPTPWRNDHWRNASVRQVGARTPRSRTALMLAGVLALRLLVPSMRVRIECDVK